MTDTSLKEDTNPIKVFGSFKTIKEKLSGVELLQNKYDIKKVGYLGQIDRASPGWLTTILIILLFSILAAVTYALIVLVLWLHIPGLIRSVIAFTSTSFPLTNDNWPESWITFWQILWLLAVVLIFLRSEGIKNVLEQELSFQAKEEKVLPLRILLVLAAMLVRGTIALFIGTFVAFSMFPVVYALLGLAVYVYEWWLDPEWIVVLLTHFWQVSLIGLVLLGLLVFLLRKNPRETLLFYNFSLLGLIGLIMIVSVQERQLDRSWIFELHQWLTGPWLANTFSFIMVIGGMAIVYPLGFAVRFSKMLWFPFRVFQKGVYLFSDRIILRWRLFKAVRYYREMNSTMIAGDSWAAVCKEHLVRFIRKTEKLAYGRRLRYGVCPKCSSDKNVYQKVVNIWLVLNRDMSEMVRQEGKVLLINGMEWLRSHDRKPVPLFDTVVIQNAEDLEIEEFITVYQSKEWDFSRKALHEIPCCLDKGIQVGENITNLLSDNFQRVNYGFDVDSTDTPDSVRVKDEIRRGTFLLRRALIRGFYISSTIGVLSLGVFLVINFTLKDDPVSEKSTGSLLKTETVEELAGSTPIMTAIVTTVPTPMISYFELDPGETIQSEIDGMTMVFIPEGIFVMGNPNGHKRDNTLDEYPAHEVNLKAYFIDLHAVTNLQYRQCVETHVCEQPQSTVSQKRSDYFTNPAYDLFPVIKVTWQDAQNYCQWVDRDLPTEAEWEKAAGWDYQLEQAKIYPWGSDDPDPAYANYGLKFGDTSLVTQSSQGVSPYGVMDMAGNVWEWVYDWYDNAYYQVATLEDLGGPEFGFYRVMRGGSWISSEFDLRVTRRHRLAPQESRFDLGFRCVWRPDL